MKKFITDAFPMKHAPLVHCITNTVTVESVANVLYFTGARPVMSEDTRELPELHAVVDAVFINLGALSDSHTPLLYQASILSRKTNKPTVIDLVGYGMSRVRNDMGDFLVSNHPTVVKGNISELRSFCKLNRHGSGVDGSEIDEQTPYIDELIQALRTQTDVYPNTVFLATGQRDIIVNKEHVLLIKNGTPLLGQFTGTGDMVGAIIAGLVGEGLSPISACATAVSYFSLCGEDAEKSYKSLAQFRTSTMDALSMQNTNWVHRVQMERM